MTIWWPRSGVWIYQIVTGVTSVVGVPSTHLVLGCKSFKTSNLVMDNLRWYKIMVNFQMYTCDSGGGSFISYVNEYLHWTFPAHSHKIFFHSMRWFLRLNLNNTKWKMISQGKSSPGGRSTAKNFDGAVRPVFSQPYPWLQRLWAKIVPLAMENGSKSNPWQYEMSPN